MWKLGNCFPKASVSVIVVTTLMFKVKSTWVRLCVRVSGLHISTWTPLAIMGKFFVILLRDRKKLTMLMLTDILEHKHKGADNYAY